MIRLKSTIRLVANIRIYFKGGGKSPPPPGNLVAPLEICWSLKRERERERERKRCSCMHNYNEMVAKRLSSLSSSCIIIILLCSQKLPEAISGVVKLN